jgi:hypothetical protein
MDDYFYDRIALQYSDYDMSNIDPEDLGIFRRAGDTWIYQGGVVAGDYIVSDEFDYDLEIVSEYTQWTLSKVGCTDPSAANYDSMAFGGEYTCNYDFSESFNAGLNLKSFYSIDDEDNSIENVLSSLDQATEIIGEGQASYLHAILGWIGSVSNINRDQGYWVRVYDDDVYEHLSGSPNHTDMVYNIHEGANLISYSGPTATSVEDAIPEGSSCYAIVGQGVATTYNETLGWIGSLTALEPWNGYWLQCSEAESFVYQGHGALPREDIEVYEVPEEFAFEQSTQQAFYFIEDIIDAVVGRDIIIAKKGDDIVGSAVYSGQYTTVPVMGVYDDIPGFNSGDVVSLQLYNPDNNKYYYLKDQELATFENLGIHMVGVMSQLPVIPEEFALHNAYPNPFNPSTTIRFDLKKQVKVELDIYDLNGRLVTTLNNKILEPGYYQMNWDASAVASGTYFVKLSAGSFVNTQKITLIK